MVPKSTSPHPSGTPLPRERGNFVVLTIIYHRNAPLPRERGRPGHVVCVRGGVRCRVEISIPAALFKKYCGVKGIGNKLFIGKKKRLKFYKNNP